ncbi:MAG TPA: VTT domain-containing protein, partial [Desulfobaccales bacterium]|nr:VTT domain-containing protein [Desulfobaccales bacterium]
MEPERPADPLEAVAASPAPERKVSELAELLGARADMADRAEYLFFLTVSMVFVLGILLYLGYIYLDPLRERLYQLVLNRERIRAVMTNAGSWGPLLFIMFQAFQVVIMIWPVPLEIAGGFVFGLPLGLLYSTLGLTLGSVLAFLLAHWLERKLVIRVVSPDRLRRFRRLMKREGTLTAFFVFLVPGIPKD